MQLNRNSCTFKTIKISSLRRRRRRRRSHGVYLTRTGETSRWIQWLLSSSKDVKNNPTGGQMEGGQIPEVNCCDGTWPTRYKKQQEVSFLMFGEWSARVMVPNSFMWRRFGHFGVTIVVRPETPPVECFQSAFLSIFYQLFLPLLFIFSIFSQWFESIKTPFASIWFCSSPSLMGILWTFVQTWCRSNLYSNLPQLIDECSQIIGQL